MSATAIDLQSIQPNDVTTISVNARIDYILRFSKHLILVVDDNAHQYTALASQYLGSLDQKDNAISPRNVAYLSASTKLNDIQMRCRIIEQLFSNTLFDPEQSLVVSVTKLAKERQQPITIVIEHAQSLSLQLKYELAQLVAVHSKTNLSIDVVLFGAKTAAEEVKTNKSLFKGKLSVIKGQTGQLISLSSSKIKAQVKENNNHKYNLLIILVTVISLISVATYYFLSNFDSSTFSYLAKAKNTEELVNPLPVIQDKDDKKINTLSKSTQEQANREKKAIKVIEEPMIATVITASSEEIHNALIQAENIDEKVITAETADIVNALNLKEATPMQEVVIQQRESPFDEQYYLSQDTGYVIQIAGFSKTDLWESFISTSSSQELYSYQRSLNDNKLIVVTSKAYSSRDDAKKAFAVLPEVIKERRPWIKSIKTVKEEIEAVSLPTVNKQ